jgi:hypothetical protein
MGSKNCCEKTNNIDNDFDLEKIYDLKGKDIGQTNKNLKNNMSLSQNNIATIRTPGPNENVESDLNNFNSNDIKLNIIYCNSYSSQHKSDEFKKNNRIIGDKKSKYYM